MPDDNPHKHQVGDNADHRRAVSRYVFFGFVAIALYLLITEHWTHITEHWGHIANVLPFLLLAACPLLHLFHHHGHDDNPPPRSPPPSASEHGTH
jgi:Protein of unknown function (DUF2933)